MIAVSDLILDFIHSEIIMIALIPLLNKLYCFQVFLDPSDTTITVMVSPLIMMMMVRASAVSNTGSRWALTMMILSLKMLNLSQCPSLPFDPHSFSSLLISDKMFARAFVIGLVLVW